MKKSSVLCLTILLMMVASVATADDVKDAEAILCSSAEVTVCYSEGDCEGGSPWTWNIPEFIEIDFTKKVLRTTVASGQNRQTPFKNFEREAGQIFLQGVEAGRAFSFVIDEVSGLSSIAVARNGVTVSVFGACTPLLSSK